MEKIVFNKMFWLCLITSLGCIYLSLQSEGVENYLLKKIYLILSGIFFLLGVLIILKQGMN